jgi:hypothetical protein
LGSGGSNKLFNAESSLQQSQSFREKLKNQDQSKFQFSSQQKDVIIAELTERIENIHLLIQNTCQNFSKIIKSPHQSPKALFNSLLVESNNLFQSQSFNAITSNY